MRVPIVGTTDAEVLTQKNSKCLDLDDRLVEAYIDGSVERYSGAHD